MSGFTFGTYTLSAKLCELNQLVQIGIIMCNLVTYEWRIANMEDHFDLIEKMLCKDDAYTLRSAFELCHNAILNETQLIENADGTTAAEIVDDAVLKRALSYLERIREKCLEQIHSGNGSEELVNLYWECMKESAPHDFDSFCLYIEKNREPSKRFYAPRRKMLKPLANALQKLEDNELDLLAISLPPGIGKTTLAIFYVCWVSGKHPELQNLIGSHNNDFLRGVYDECLRIMQPGGEYLWSDIFPVGVSGTNAKDMKIDLGKRKRFTTIELTSIGSQNAGKVRASNLLYCDDLVSGIEQAMSKDQMDKLWQAYTVDLRQRKIGNRCKELHIATRWSLVDVIGRLENIYEDDDRAMFINVPARDEDGESQFDYPYGLGYTTQALDDLEASFDDASWKALYMGQPIERDGQLYAPEELRRYFELPEREPDAILAVSDTKEQGNDYCSTPFAYIYGQDVYIDDWICDNGKPDVIEDRIVSKITDKNVSMIRFESNRGGTIFASNVQRKLKEKGSKCRVTTKWNQTNKETRILVASSWVKEHCLFKDESLYLKQNKEYRTAMNMLTSYSMAGGRANKHDDVPDSLADLENFVDSLTMTKVEVIKRPF